MASASEQELNLHHRLISGDETATAELSIMYYEKIIEHFIKKHKRTIADEDMIVSITADVILDYVDRPLKYNPEKRSLYGYLKMAVDGDIRNAIAKQTKVNNNQKEIDDTVELDTTFRNSIHEVDHVSKLIDEEIEQRTQKKIERMFPDAIDQAIIELMRSKVRKTEDYAKVLGVKHLSIKEQFDIVKRNKDRIKAKLSRELVRIEKISQDRKK